MIAALLMRHQPESCVVFCNTRRDVAELVGSIAHYGFSALALHGDMEQRDRDEVLVRFANRSCSVLVASDVAARGLDVEDIGAVVDYELQIGRASRRERVCQYVETQVGGGSCNKTMRETNQLHDHNPKHR